MISNWTNGTDLRPRIDAEYYSPAFIETERRLAQHIATAPFRKLWRNSNRIYIGIAGFDSVDDESQYTPYLRPADISDDGWINYGQLAWCKREWLKDHEKNGCAVPGDLIIEVKGYTRKVAIVSTEIPPRCIVSGSSYRVQLKPEHDPYFLFAYLLSPTGQQLKRRLVSNTAISYIDPDSFKSYLVPIPKDGTQRAVGSKVRAAERLRAAAAARVANAKLLIEVYFGGADLKSLKPNADGSCDYFSSFIQPTELGAFHGAQFFAPKRKRAVELVRSTGCSASLGDHGRRLRAKGKRTSARPHVDPGNVAGSDGYWSSGGPDDGGDVVLAKPGQTLFLRMRPYLNKTTINDTDQTVSGSPEFLVYGLEGLDAFYATLCLRQPWALAQVAEIATGDRPRVDGDFVDEVLVPWPDENERKEIGKLYRQSFALRRRADDLVKQAIADVENLIDGKLDEAACLEQGRRLAQEFGFEMP